MKQYIEIRKYLIGDYSVVKRIDVSDQTDRSIDRIDRGMNINLDHGKYYTQIVCTQLELEEIK